MLIVRDIEFPVLLVLLACYVVYAPSSSMKPDHAIFLISRMDHSRLIVSEATISNRVLFIVFYLYTTVGLYHCRKERR